MRSFGFVALVAVAEIPGIFERIAIRVFPFGAESDRRVPESFFWNLFFCFRQVVYPVRHSRCRRASAPAGRGIIERNIFLVFSYVRNRRAVRVSKSETVSFELLRESLND